MQCVKSMRFKPNFKVGLTEFIVFSFFAFVFYSFLLFFLNGSAVDHISYRYSIVVNFIEVHSQIP